MSNFSNSLIKNRIEILENSDQKLIFKTFLGAKGGQNQLHYHTKFNEKFTVLEGELNITIEQEEKVFTVSDSSVIRSATNHMFLNNSNQPSCL